MFIARLRGDVRGELEYASVSLDNARKSGMPWLIALNSFALGTALLDNNEREKGLALLSEARKLAIPIKSHTVEYLSLIIEAEYFLMRSEEQAGLDALAKALAIGKKQGFVNNSAWRQPVMAFLCAKALAAGIEVEHVQELIRKRNLVPDSTSLELENWPWPVRIYTLGQFRIECDGKPLTFTGKVQKKPLALLKTLIAFGCQGVSEVKVMDALWPDAEGDSAYRSFVSTLQRLRKLLGLKEALLLQDGNLSLDPRFCWLDCLAFDQTIKKADDVWKTGKKQDAVKLYEQSLTLYKGPLLGRDNAIYRDMALSTSLREQFARCTKRLGHHAE